MQQQGLLDGQGGRRRGVGGISGHQGTGAVLAELLAEVTHRARAEVQGAGDGGGLKAALPVAVDALPKRDGQRRRHRVLQQKGGKTVCRCNPVLAVLPGRGKPAVAIRGKPAVAIGGKT